MFSFTKEFSICLYISSLIIEQVSRPQFSTMLCLLKWLFDLLLLPLISSLILFLILLLLLLVNKHLIEQNIVWASRQSNEYNVLYGKSYNAAYFSLSIHTYELAYFNLKRASMFVVHINKTNSTGSMVGSHDRTLVPLARN